MKEIIKIVSEKAKSLIENSKDQCTAHKWDHVERVLKNALYLAKDYKNVDIDCLKLACFLHDANEPYYDKKCHVQRSLKTARKILGETEIPEEKKNKVLKIISEHSLEDVKGFSSIESKILFDADKLDGFGPIGIARVFILCGRNGLTPKQAVKWYRKKIKITEKNLQTEKAKK